MNGARWISAVLAALMVHGALVLTLVVWGADSGSQSARRAPALARIEEAAHSAAEVNTIDIKLLDAPVANPRPPTTDRPPAPTDGQRPRADHPPTTHKPAAAGHPAPSRPHAAPSTSHPPSTQQPPATTSSATDPADGARTDSARPPNAKTIRDYSQQVRSAVAKHKRMPRRAQRLGLRGEVVIAITISASGRGSVRLRRSSGVPDLDGEALRMARAASLPTPPTAPLTVVVPVDFE